jgi:tetratricopeptide (TPR) repeat protein
MRLNHRITLAQTTSPLRISILLACLLLGVNGCASNASKKQAAALPEQSVEANTETANELNADFVYKYLVGEVAGQRGDLATSSSIFFDLARKEQDPRLAERAAKVAAYGNVSSLTIPAVKLWAELDPDSAEAQQAMIEMLIATGKLEDTEPYLAKLLLKEETRASGFLYLNALLNRSADKAGVLALIQKLAKPYPKSPEAQFAIAQAAWAAGQDDVSLQALNQADALKPGWYVAALLKGQVLFNKSPEEALAFYQGFLVKHPEATEIRMNMAKLMVTQKQYEAAKKEYAVILKNSKGNADVTTVVGLLSYQSADYAEADKYFQQALEQGFKDPDQIYIYLGQSAEKQNHDGAAEAWYKKVEVGPRYLEAQLDLANLIARTQSVDKAIDLLDGLEGLTTEQQILVIQSEAGLLVKAKRNQDAFDLLEKTVKNLPNTPELVYDYALAAERVQKLEVMETELRKLIAAKPDFAAAYNALGYSFADRNIKLDEAQKLIEKALSISPNDHYMLDSLGWVYYRKGELDKAIDYLQQAYKTNPDPEIAAHLGEVLWQKGQHEEAKKIWQDALSANPDNEVLVSTRNKFKS